MSTSFEMTVREFFTFDDGRTVFVGPVVGGEKLIPAGQCELWVRGVKRTTINIEGEMIPERRHHKDYRVVSTQEPIPLDRALCKKFECKLRTTSNHAS